MPGAPITLVWGDGEQRFALPIDRMRELQEKTGVGPYVLYRRMAAGEWLVDDLRETIRIGLVGGGMKPADAVRLVTRYYDVEGGYLDHVPVASAILLAGLSTPLGTDAPKADATGTSAPEPTPEG